MMLALHFATELTTAISATLTIVVSYIVLAEAAAPRDWITTAFGVVLLIAGVGALLACGASL